MLYIACILSFVWRAGTTKNEPTYVLSFHAELGIRIAFSAVFALGVVYFALITRTLWHYGDRLDNNFKKDVASWAREHSKLSHRPSHTGPPVFPAGRLPPPRSYRSHSASTGEHTLFPSYTPYRATTPVSSTYSRPDTPPLVRPNLEPFSPQKVMDLRFQNQGGNMMPQSLERRFSHNSWQKFIEVPHYTCAKSHDAE